MGSSALQRLLVRMANFNPPVRNQLITLQASMFSSFIADTWFRILVKMAARDASSSYSWYEMTFFSRWAFGHCTILCIGVSSLFKGLLQAALSQLGMRPLPLEPHLLHVPLVEAVVAMQDISVWAVRDIVRNVEKASTLA